VLETVATATAVVDVLLLGVGGTLLRYIIRLESRLTRIETKLSID
jgi:hypothetical protein